MKCKQIIYTEKNKAELLTVDATGQALNEVMVGAMGSTISYGIERVNLTEITNANSNEASGVYSPKHKIITVPIRLENVDLTLDTLMTLGFFTKNL